MAGQLPQKELETFADYVVYHEVIICSTPGDATQGKCAVACLTVIWCVMGGSVKKKCVSKYYFQAEVN